MKKMILTLALAAAAMPALANYHPIARTTVVATSDHPVAMAAATSNNDHHPVARATVVASSDHPVAAATVTRR